MNREEVYLRDLENKSIYILREAYANFRSLAMLWSIGKDSTVLLWLARKAFFGHVPIPLVHVDTQFKIPEMISYRDNLAMEWNLTMIVGKNYKSLELKETFPDGNVTRLECCKNLKSTALQETLNATCTRMRLNHQTGEYEPEDNPEPFTGVILGIRADEEGSRSKERYFSPRDHNNQWDVGNQPPELWNQYKTEFAPSTHVRVHPLLDWKEVDIWQYIEKEKIPTVSSYYDDGSGKRYRSLGCYPCTDPVESSAKTPKEIIEELKTGKFLNIAERSGRAQDNEDGGSLEALRKEGYM